MLNKLTNNQLIKEYLVTRELIYVIQCYGKRDVIYLQQIEQEMIRRKLKRGTLITSL